jgi:hypothetical protein
MFWRKPALSPLSPGERDIWAKVCVDLPAPISFEGKPGGPPVVGYFQNFGLRMRQGEPARLLERAVIDGRINWNDSELNDVVSSQLHRDIRKAITAPDTLGIWYRSGKIFFPEEGQGAG